jgi:N-acetylneuraminic acid mutarotase
MMTGIHSSIIVTDYADDGGPTERSRASVVIAEKVGYLDTEPKLLLFGGTNGEDRFYADLWALDLGFLPLVTVEAQAAAKAADKSIELNPEPSVTWNEIGTDASIRPPGRAEHTMVSTTDGRVIMFGGTNDRAGQTAMSDMWQYDAKKGDGIWQEIPSPFNSTSDICYCFPGESQCVGQKQWPFGKYGHSATAIGNEMLVFGGWSVGCGREETTDELWSFDTGVGSYQWMRMPPTSLRPVARTSHAAIVIGDALLIFGGWDAAAKSPLEDIWMFSPASQKWSLLRTTNSRAEPGPSARYGALLAPVAGGMFLYSGSDRTAVSDDVSDSGLTDLWVYTFPADKTTTTSVISESMPDENGDGEGDGTRTTTNIIKTSPVNNNTWASVSVDYVPGDEWWTTSQASGAQRLLPAGAVWGLGGTEHIILFSGIDSGTGRPLAKLRVISLSADVPWTGGLIVGLICGTVGVLLLVCFGWRSKSFMRRRRLVRRWQTAYLKIRAHLETKKLAEANKVAVENDALEVESVRGATAESTRRRRTMG